MQLAQFAPPVCIFYGSSASNIYAEKTVQVTRAEFELTSRQTVKKVIEIIIISGFNL